MSIGMHPLHEETHGELIEVLERSLLRAGRLGRVWAKHTFEVRALLDQSGGVHREGLLVLPDIDGGHGMLSIGSLELVLLTPVDTRGERFVLCGLLDRALRKWHKARLGGCRAWSSGGWSCRRIGRDWSRAVGSSRSRSVGRGGRRSTYSRGRLRVASGAAHGCEVIFVLDGGAKRRGRAGAGDGLA